MNDIVVMHVLHSLANLSDVFDHFGLTHWVAVIGNTIEQLATR